MTPTFFIALYINGGVQVGISQVNGILPGMDGIL